MSPFIPLTRPFMVHGESTAVAETLATGHWAGNGRQTRESQERLEALTGRQVRLTTSGTTALDLMAHALPLEPGDEVVVPSYTFVSTATAFVGAGLVPVFADVDPETANLDPRSIERVLSSRTRVIVPVHYAGVSADMDSIQEIGRRHHLVVVEDAAQGVGATYRGSPLGAIGDLGAFSFHQTKHVACGEGGAVVVGNPAHLERIEILREIGTDRARFRRGEIDHYSWVGRGSNYLLSDLLASVLGVQLAALPEIIEKRNALYQQYVSALRDVADAGLLRLPRIPENCGSNFQSFHVFLPDRDARIAVQAHLQAEGIGAGPHYRPLHLTDGGRRHGLVRSPLTGAEKVGECLLRLPLFTDLSSGDVDRVCQALTTFLKA